MSNDNDDPINSEIIWTFNDFKKQVTDAYPNGQAISEQILTVGGQNTWKIEFYPNGKDKSNENKIFIQITYTETRDNNEHVETDAECNYRILNKDENKNYVGKIDRQLFKSLQSAHDADFDKAILDDCKHSALIGICISQYEHISKKQQNESDEDLNKNNATQQSLASPNEDEVKQSVEPVSSLEPSTNADDDYKKSEAQPLL